MQTYDCIVVGAGPAGMLAAATAAGRGRGVLLIDKNTRPGRKLLITGKGRCNLTNDCDVQQCLDAVLSNPRFLYSAFNALPPRELMAMFEGLGVPLKVERGRRVFPQSDRAGDIAAALERLATDNGVRLRQAAMREVLVEDGAVSGIITANGERLAAQSVLLATGGYSYPGTGSTGEGHRAAKALGHRVVPCRGSLVPVVLADAFAPDLMGLSLKNVTLTLRDAKGSTCYAEQGELLFTHFGISGPLTLSASAHMRGDAASYSLSVDLKPALTHEKLDERVLRDFAKLKNRDFQNSLGELLPQKLIPIVVERSGIPPRTKVNTVSREQRQALVSLLKNFTLHPLRLRPIEEAVVTAGGVDVRDVAPGTMQSKIIPGLYFAGEILDVDAYTGGYNLQIAFSTGLLAGQNM